jgi:hypothetical protein
MPHVYFQHSIRHGCVRSVLTASRNRPVTFPPVKSTSKLTEIIQHLEDCIDVLTTPSHLYQIRSLQEELRR